VLTAIRSRSTDANKYVLRGVAASLGLFALLRLAWIEARLVLPVTQMQAALASRIFGTPAAPVEVTLACSGADALALFLGAVLAYPTGWRTRLTGAGAGVALILGLNTIRIGTLGLAAASPAWFAALHLYVWPAVLTLAIAGYVFGWMRVADHVPGRAMFAGLPEPSRRFVGLTIVFLLIFLATSPLYLDSAAVLALSGGVARGAAAALALAGISAHASGNLLWTARGGFVVTQECVATPLIPVYLGAVCAYSPTWRRAALGVAATVPIFVALGVVRLFLVALPASVASPLFFVHAFYQLLFGAIVVCLAAFWRHGRTAAAHAVAGILAGTVSGVLLAPLLVRTVASAGVAPLDDPQGAIAFLPAYQAALYVALWVATGPIAGWRAFAAGFAILGVTLTAALLTLHALASYVGAAVHVRDVRAGAIAAPVLIFAAMVRHAPSSR
jgi:exosortase/archaeosortase family protein